jgi:hypothetical protein
MVQKVRLAPVYGGQPQPFSDQFRLTTTPPTTPPLIGPQAGSHGLRKASQRGRQESSAVGVRESSAAHGKHRSAGKQRGRQASRSVGIFPALFALAALFFALSRVCAVLRTRNF